MLFIFKKKNVSIPQTIAYLEFSHRILMQLNFFVNIQESTSEIQLI